jgi:cytochrome b561
MKKQIIHWLVAIAVVLQLLSVIFTGQLHLPDMPW